MSVLNKLPLCLLDQEIQKGFQFSTIKRGTSTTDQNLATISQFSQICCNLPGEFLAATVKVGPLVGGRVSVTSSRARILSLCSLNWNSILRNPAQ